MPSEPAHEGEPGTVEAGAKKLKTHNEGSVFSKLTEQAGGRRKDGTVEEGRPRPAEKARLLKREAEERREDRP